VIGSSWVDCPFRGVSSRASSGQGTGYGFRLSERPLMTIARLRALYPDPRNSDTLCRRDVTTAAGGATLARCASRASFYESTGRARLRGARPPAISLSQDLPAGPLCTFPREGERDPPAQGAFHRGPFPPGWGRARASEQATMSPREIGRLSTDCSQPVEYSPAPLQPLPIGHVLTDVP
jgi:hypothetical protein